MKSQWRVSDVMKCRRQPPQRQQEAYLGGCQRFLSFLLACLLQSCTSARVGSLPQQLWSRHPRVAETIYMSTVMLFFLFVTSCHMKTCLLRTFILPPYTRAYICVYINIYSYVYIIRTYGKGIVKPSSLQTKPGHFV